LNSIVTRIGYFDIEPNFFVPSNKKGWCTEMKFSISARMWTMLPCTVVMLSAYITGGCNWWYYDSKFLYALSFVKLLCSHCTVLVHFKNDCSVNILRSSFMCLHLRSSFMCLHEFWLRIGPFGDFYEHSNELFSYYNSESLSQFNN
jgi:hypothetical protein